MGIFPKIRSTACLFALALASCSGITSGADAECFFCDAPVRHVHGYMSSRGPMPRETTFVHKGETVYVDGPATVVAYDGITVAYASARVSGFDNATIYYYDRALVQSYGPHVRLIYCGARPNSGFDPKSCGKH